MRFTVRARRWDYTDIPLARRLPERSLLTEAHSLFEPLMSVGAHPRKFPDSLVLLFVLIVLAQVATYVLPAGEFERDGRQVIPGTYRTVQADRLPLQTFLTAIPAGLAAAQDIIFFVFVVGGVIAVVRATGAIDALIGAAIRHLSHRPALLMFGTVVLLRWDRRRSGWPKSICRSCRSW